MLAIVFCEKTSVLYVFFILKILFKIITIILPIIIMYRAIAPFAKSVIDKEEFSKFVPNIFKSFLAALIIFFLPTLFTYLFGTLLGDETLISDLNACFVNANLKTIELYKEAEKIEDEEERKAVLESLVEAGNSRKEKEKAFNNSVQKFREAQKKKEEESKTKVSDPSNSPSSSTGTSTVPAGNITIHVGDSRTVGMCGAITGSLSGCSYNSSGPKVYGNDIFIAQGSMAYSWFESTAVPAVNNIISNNPDNTYNVISYMGVNWLLYDIDKYTVKYNALAKGDWSNVNIVLVSVNPVDEQIEAQNGYSTRNADIVMFNTKLKNGINAGNLRYCDVYNTILGSFQTGDGLHYTSDTYKSIYSKAKSCI